MRLLRRSVLAAVAAAVVFVCSALVAPSASATGYQISTDSVADPGFATYGSTYYVYGTGPRGQNIPMYTSSSLSDAFTLAGYAFPTASLDGYSDVWAPHVVSRGGRYFMFFTASHLGARHCIYWAVSPTNTPRSYSAPTLLLCAANRKKEVWEAIDPSTYKTVDDNTYLVWRSGHIQKDFPVGDYQIRAVELAFSGSSVALAKSSPRIKLLGVENKTVVEAPDLILYDHLVYLFVSRGDYRDDSYRTDVYIAKSIHDTFRLLKKGVMKTGQGFGSGPGGAEVLGLSATSTRIAWHFRDGSGRHVRVGVVSWTKSSPTAAYVPSVV